MAQISTTGPPHFAGPGPGADSGAPGDTVEAEQIRLLLHNPVDVPINLVNAALVGVVVWPLYPAWVLAMWLGMMCVVSLARAVLRRRYADSAGDARKSPQWARIFTANAFVAGCLWGLAASVILATPDPVYYDFIVFVLGGTMAGGIVCIAINLRAMYAFILPTILPAIAALLVHGGLMQLDMAGMLALFTGALAWTGRSINRSITENIRLRFGLQAMVTNLKISEAAMAASQSMAHVGSWAIDLGTKADTWSAETYRIFGVDPASFQPSMQALIARTHPDDRHVVSDDYATLLATGTSRGFDIRIVLNDGAIRHVHEQGELIRDATGRPLKIIGTVQDVTERMKGEAASARLAAIVNSSADAIISETVTGTILSWNRGAEQLFGHGAAEAIGQSIRMIMPDERRTEVDRVLATMALGRSIPPFDTERLRKDGTRVAVSIAISLIQDPAQAVACASFIARDITERRKADDKLAYANLVLRTQMEASLDGMLVVDANKAIVMYNQRFAEIWRIAPAALATRSDVAVLAQVASAVKDAGKFSARVQHLYEHPGEDSRDEYETTDGRTIDRYTVTLYGPSRAYLGRAWFFRDITERRRIEALALRIARYDALTGLANRAVFVVALQRAIETARRGDQSFAVLYLDLDHFKDVNDTLGHPAGDELLKAVADRLRVNIREADTVARFGGDEFAIILADVRDPAAAALVADELLSALANPFSVHGGDIYSGASIGIAAYGPEASDAESLLSHADVALYRAKSEGRGGYRFFTDAMDRDVKARVTISAELRVALDKDQLFLMYQPQVAIDGGQITGVEALVRWRHPTRGILGPDLFIPIAEQTGSIARIGHWVLWEACKQCRRWVDAGIAPARMCVNVSALQFRSRVALESDIAAALAQTGLAPHLLELELTESVLMDAAREHGDMLTRLRKTGVTIAIDDFGTGYSSLDYLRRFPSNRIKIAQNFVTHLESTPGDSAIIRATIALAHELHIDVIAEGVESQMQCDMLKKWGCGEVQGFLFSSPLTAEDAAAALRRGTLEPRPVRAVAAVGA